MLLGVGFDLLGERALVEGFASRGCDLLERLRMLRELEALPRFWRVTVRQERISEAGLALQLRHLLRPLTGDGGRDEETFAAISNGALEETLEGQLAPFGVHLVPR